MRTGKIFRHTKFALSSSKEKNTNIYCYQWRGVGLPLFWKGKKEMSSSAQLQAEKIEINKFWSFGNEFELYVGEEKVWYVNRKRRLFAWRVHPEEKMSVCRWCVRVSHNRNISSGLLQAVHYYNEWRAQKMVRTRNPHSTWDGNECGRNYTLTVLLHTFRLVLLRMPCSSTTASTLLNILSATLLAYVGLSAGTLYS